MWEVIPVVLGGALGLAAGSSGRTAVVRLVCGALAIGIVVALASGELAESAAFVVVDAALALLAAVLARSLAVFAARRRSSV
jgi:hypothetical protein